VVAARVEAGPARRRPVVSREKSVTPSTLTASDPLATITKASALCAGKPKKEPNMKRNYPALLLALALATPALIASAQDAEKPRNPRPRADQGEKQPPPDGERPRAPRPEGQGQGGPGQGGVRPPLLAALDANNDGVIDEKEIENASKALKKLDKNGDGKLTPDEIRPARPGGPQGGPRPPEGQGFNRGGGQGRPDGPPPGDGEGQPRHGQRPPPEKE